jgi:hypothetical protein
MCQRLPGVMVEIYENNVMIAEQSPYLESNSC